MTENCYFCGKEITSFQDCLVLNDHFAKWPAAFFSHPECCDEQDPFPFTYGVHLSRIIAYGNPANPHEQGCDSLLGWEVHLSQKNWITAEMLAALRRAHYLAVSLKAAKSVGVPRPEPRKIRDARAKVTGKVRAFVFARDGHQCKKCGAPPPLVVDHIMPVSKGGSGEPDNLRSLCWDCNASKGASLEVVQ